MRIFKIDFDEKVIYNPSHFPYAIQIVQELLGHEDVETTQIYTHVMAKRLQSVRSPADMFGNGFLKPNPGLLGSPGRAGIVLGELPVALEKRLREAVTNKYKGDIQAALAGFLDLHDKHQYSELYEKPVDFSRNCFILSVG